MDAEERRQGGLGHAELPEVTRLNRNVLLVAGMGVGVIILAITHVVRSDAPTAPLDGGGPPVEGAAVPSFLRDPSQQAPGGAPVPPPAYPELAAPASLSVEDVSPAYASGGYAGASYDPYAGAFDPPSPPPEPDPRALAYRRALQAGLRSRPAAAPAPSAGWDPLADPEALRVAEGMPGGVPAYAYAAAPAARPPAPQPRSRHEEFLGAAAATGEPTAYVASRVQPPVSEYQLMAGTVLPAMVVTEINSDLPGEILAQLSRNIYDSQQRHLLIPSGTRVIGRYDSQVALGQSRVLIAWTRLLFPDGRSISLPGLPTKDLQGASGLRSRVDNHTGRLYGQAILLSILGAGAQLSQPQQGSVFAPPSAGQVAAGALGQELSQVSMETVRRNMDVRPTLRVPVGTRFSIFLERDLVLDGPYLEIPR